jgi:hypothetical protein
MFEPKVSSPRPLISQTTESSMVCIDKVLGHWLRLGLLITQLTHGFVKNLTKAQK